MLEAQISSNPEMARRFTRYLQERGKLREDQAIPTQTIQSIVSGRSKSTEYAADLAGFFKRPVGYFLSEDGDRVAPRGNAGAPVSLLLPGDPDETAVVEVHRRHKALLEAYLSLTPELRKPIRLLVETLAAEKREHRAAAAVA